jgi:hypothetical protein
VALDFCDVGATPPNEAAQLNVAFVGTASAIWHTAFTHTLTDWTSSVRSHWKPAEMLVNAPPTSGSYPGIAVAERPFLP